MHGESAQRQRQRPQASRSVGYEFIWRNPTDKRLEREIYDIFKSVGLRNFGMSEDSYDDAIYGFVWWNYTAGQEGRALKGRLRSLLMRAGCSVYARTKGASIQSNLDVQFSEAEAASRLRKPRKKRLGSR